MMKLNMKKTIKLFFLMLLISNVGSMVSAVEIATLKSDITIFEEEDEFLDVDDAFSISTDQIDDEFIIRWTIADGYYLYKHRFSFDALGADLAEPIIPDGIKKVDEYFGAVEVYYKHIEIALPFTNATEKVVLTLKYQGCADAGLCYTPAKRYLTYEKQPDGSLMLTSGVETKIPGVDSTPIKSKIDKPTEIKTESSTGKKQFIGETQSLSSVLENENLFWTLLAFLGAGLLLTFTPCVLPMIPILSGIIAGQGKDITPAKAFRLSFVYVQAMAITYAILGVLVAQAGSSLSGYLQSPIILSVVAGIFVLLAFSMFGLFEIKLPAFIESRIQGVTANQRGGNYIGVAIMGVISTLIVSPCTSAPLTAALLFIANSGNSFMGGLSLYFLGLGMGIPLLIIGVGGGRLMPKAGAWMDTVKLIFGFIMIGMALYITSHLIPGPLYLFLWAVLLIIASNFFGAFTSETTVAGLLKRSLAIILFVIGSIYLVGAAMGNGRLLQPLVGMQSSHTQNSASTALAFERVANLKELQGKLDQAKKMGRPVMLDFFADWCVACFEFEDFTFSDAAVQNLLKTKNVLLLQVDVTANSTVDIELMKHFNIFGLPAILLFDSFGNEKVDMRATGFEDAETFFNRLGAVFGSS